MAAATAVASPQYIQLLLRSEFFRARINGMVSGASGRKRLSPDLFEAMHVPLPGTSVQEKIVSEWQRGQSQAQEAEQSAAKVVARSQSAFLAALGLVAHGEVEKLKGFALRWSAIGRWGVELNQPGKKQGVDASRFPVVRLSDVIQDLCNGWSPKCLDRPAQGDEWGVLKLGAVSFGSFNPDQNKALPPGLKALPDLEIQSGDLLISRANITRLVGACALVDKTPPRLMLCDKIFKAVWIKNSPVLPEYLDAVLKIPHLRQQIEAALTGTSPTMKNISKPSLLALRFPLPPKAEQVKIVAMLANARAEADGLRNKAAQLRAQAKQATEAALFGG